MTSQISALKDEIRYLVQIILQSLSIIPIPNSVDIKQVCRMGDSPDAVAALSGSATTSTTIWRSLTVLRTLSFA